MNFLARDWRKAKRRQVERVFVKEKLIIDSRKEFPSPSGLYTLEIERYQTKPVCWNYSRGIVKRRSDGKLIADVKRNYEMFWHSWVRHKNGNEYLLCGEDYQGYTVIDLAKAEIRTHLPDAAKNGWAFCWAAVYPSADGLVLGVEGCLWGGSFNLIFYDFSKPLDLPFPEIGRIEEIQKVIGWETDTVFAVEHEFIIRKSDEKRFELLSQSEQDEYCEHESRFAYRTEVLRWDRSARSLIR